MAAKQPTFSEEIDDNFLSCIICSERYKNAKLLPCLHSFCESCLDKLAEEGGTITCPICRRSHQLPDTGVAGVCGNAFINELVRMFKRHEGSSTEQKTCDGCQEAVSVKHCIECEVDMCRICAVSHSRFRVSRSHQQMTLEEFEATKSGPVYCTNHSESPVEFYCDTCDRSICSRCTASEHSRPEHQYGHLKEVVTEYYKVLKQAIEKVKVKEHEAYRSKTGVIETAESLESCYQAEKENMQQYIQKTIDDVTRIIRENGEKLLGELEEEYDRRKINLNAQLKELECIESDMSYAREYAEKLMHYGNAAQLMSAKKGMSAQMEELLRVETKLDPTETDYMEFKPSDDFCKTKTVGVLCNDLAERCTLVDVPEHVRVNENIDITLKTGTRHDRCKVCELKVDAVLTKPDKRQENIAAADNGNSTWSLKTVAKMVGNHEITVSVSNNQIVGSQVTIRAILQKGLICKFGTKGSGLREFKDAWGVMVTGDGNIRMCDRGNKRLQTFTLNGQYQSTTTFSNISRTVSPNWSAVSEDGTIFTSNATGGRVIVHDENGRVLRCFGKGVISYCFGIAISPLDGRVYVVDYEGHRVHIYDQDGNYCKSFGCEGQGQGQLCYPVGITIDSEGLIFVSDYGNHRIQVFDAEGQYLYSFGSEGSGDSQMRNPTGIVLDCDNNVYVCDCGNNRVMKYESGGKFICRIDSKDKRVDYPRGICVTNDKPFGFVVVTNSKGHIHVFSQ